MKKRDYIDLYEKARFWGNSASYLPASPHFKLSIPSGL